MAWAFDLNWENSWRASSDSPTNYDAAWVFIKYRVNGGVWRHAELSGTGNVPPNATAELKNGKGAMIYRSANGTGPVTFFNVELFWNSAPANLAPADARSRWTSKYSPLRWSTSPRPPII